MVKLVPKIYLPKKLLSTPPYEENVIKNPQIIHLSMQFSIPIIIFSKIYKDEESKKNNANTGQTGLT